MYQFFITFDLIIIYFILFFLFPLFFKNILIKPNAKSLPALLIIVVVSFLSYLIAFSIPNEWLGNRISHIFGGGFVSFLVCFLAAKNANLNINKLQFFLFSFSIVTTLGVGNEIIEFFLQSYFHVIFAKTVSDTWLDLISNAVGALIAAAVFIPFIKVNQARQTAALKSGQNSLQNQ